MGEGVKRGRSVVPGLEDDHLGLRSTSPVGDNESSHYFLENCGSSHTAGNLVVVDIVSSRFSSNSAAPCS